MKLKLSLLKKLLNINNFQTENIELDNFFIDSRIITPNSVFIAIKGKYKDGHDYIIEAIENGAICIIVDKNKNLKLKFEQQYNKKKIFLLEVEDTLQALHKIAKQISSQFKGKKIAITGSYGKTTLKELITHILRKTTTVICSQGNNNNELGIPVTIFKLKEQEFAIFEMGARNIGDIDILSSMIQPNIAIITTIDSVHLEIFQTLDNIAFTKSEVIKHLVQNGICILNKDNAYYKMLEKKARKQNNNIKVISFGIKKLSKKPDYSLEHFDHNMHGSNLTISYCNKKEIYKINSFGQSIGINTFIAIIVCRQLGLEQQQVQKALNSFSYVKGRMQVIEINNKTNAIYDAYNSNPSSLISAIESALTMNNNIILIIGDMGELGDQAQLIHNKIGKQIAQNYNVELIAIGRLSLGLYQEFKKYSSNQAKYFKSTQYINHLEQLIFDSNKKNTLLFKASRVMGFEKILTQLNIQN